MNFMKQNKSAKSLILEVTYVLLSMGILTLFEKKFPFLAQDLIGAPYLVILTITVLFGSYLTGLLAIAIGVMSIGLVSLSHGHVDEVTIRRSIEFLVGGTTIFILSYRSRNLMMSHINLEDTISQLDTVTKQLISEVKLKKKDLDKLSKLNKDLRLVIDDVMEDKTYWASSVKSSLSELEAKKKK